MATLSGSELVVTLSGSEQDGGALRIRAGGGALRIRAGWWRSRDRSRMVALPGPSRVSEDRNPSESKRFQDPPQ